MTGKHAFLLTRSLADLFAALAAHRESAETLLGDLLIIALPRPRAQDTPPAALPPGASPLR